MIEARSRRCFPRYPTKQAVTLPALHIVNDSCATCRCEAVVEIAELLGLAPAQVQDTLTFYGFFKQDKPRGKCGLGVPLDQLRLRGGEEVLEPHVSPGWHQAGRNDADGR